MEIEMRNTHRRERDRKSSKSCFISQMTETVGVEPC